MFNQKVFINFYAYFTILHNPAYSDIKNELFNRNKTASIVLAVLYNIGIIEKDADKVKLIQLGERSVLFLLHHQQAHIIVQ